MRVKVEIINLAKIELAEIYLDKFVLFVGDNNSGKTITMELLYGIVKLLSEWKVNMDNSNVKMTEREDIKYIRFDQKWIIDLQDTINRYLQENKEEFIVNCFSQPIPLESIKLFFEDIEGYFFIATISDKVRLERQNPIGDRECLIEDVDVPVGDVESMLAQSILMNMIGLNVKEKQIFIPAARAGLQMLYRQFFVSSSNSAGLPTPIYEFLKFIQTYSEKNVYTKNESEIINFIEQNILGGKVEFENNEFVYKEGESVIPINFASSMINELSILTSVFKSNDSFGLLYYDEVENSVHPIMQGNVARSLIRTCNSGKNVIVSTHSDTMAGKINNLLLLSRMENVTKRNEKLEKIGLDVADMLDKEKNVMVYEFKKNANGKVKVDCLEFMQYPRIGYEFGRFNENIDKLYDESTYIME